MSEIWMLTASEYQHRHSFHVGFMYGRPAYMCIVLFVFEAVEIIELTYMSQ